MQSLLQGLVAAGVLIGIILLLRRASGRVEGSAVARKVGLSPGGLFILVLFGGFFISMLLVMGACP